MEDDCKAIIDVCMEGLRAEGKGGVKVSSQNCPWTSASTGQSFQMRKNKSKTLSEKELRFIFFIS